MTYPKALIIDDNPSDRTLTLRELKKLFSQLQAKEINDEVGLIEALQTDDFNIVITDYQLLWTTGNELLTTYFVRWEYPKSSSFGAGLIPLLSFPSHRSMAFTNKLATALTHPPQAATPVPCVDM